MDTLSMDRERIRNWLENKAEFSFSRSSGPGGQNVNKVNTKTMIRVPITEIEGLEPEERLRLFVVLEKRLASGDVLVVQVQDERSQLLNRSLAVDRALEIIERGLRREKPRRPTKPSRASKERRLEAKRISSAIKRNRSRVDE